MSDSKWEDMNDEKLVEVLRNLGNAVRKTQRDFQRTIYDVAADRIEALLSEPSGDRSKE